MIKIIKIWDYNQLVHEMDYGKVIGCGNCRRDFNEVEESWYARETGTCPHCHQKLVLVKVKE